MVVPCLTALGYAPVKVPDFGEFRSLQGTLDAYDPVQDAIGAGEEIPVATLSKMQECATR